MSLYQKERTQTPPERWNRLVCTGLRGFWLVSPLGYLQSLRYLGIETYGLQTSLLLYSHCCGITPQRENGNDHQASRGTENHCVLALTTTEGVPTSSAPRNAHWGHTTVRTGYETDTVSNVLNPFPWWNKGQAPLKLHSQGVLEGKALHRWRTPGEPSPHFTLIHLRHGCVLRPELQASKMVHVSGLAAL